MYLFYTIIVIINYIYNIYLYYAHMRISNIEIMFDTILANI